MSLDWFKPVESQIPCQPSTVDQRMDLFDCDVILASDTVWLSDLLDSFVTTVHSILQVSQNAACYLAYKDRATSDVFVSSSKLVSAFTGKGLHIQKLSSVTDLPSSQPSQQQSQQEQVSAEIILFKITN